MVWYELRKGASKSEKPQWVEHIVGKEGAGHGIGFGDARLADDYVNLVNNRP